MDVISSKRNRDGVALILVVGMLALLMVMGVSFAVFMRTERIAAGNFRNDVQARQLLHVALARAIGDIEFHASVTNAHYPEWFVLASSNAVGNVVSNSAWATNMIPWGAVGGVWPNVQWIDVGQSGCSGRIAYACINASGLLDINYAGAGTRASGTNASEIQISVLPDVQNAAALVSPRSIKPYETLQDVNTAGAAGLREAARSFITYSANPKSYPNGASESWVDIGGDETLLKTKAKHDEIVPALLASVQGLSAVDAEFMYTNLLDYVDVDHVPRDLASPCTESVPMINEVYIRLPYAFLTDGRLASTPNLISFEWNYPFVKSNPNTYWLTYSITFQKGAGSGPTLTDDFVPNPVAGSVQLSYNNEVSRIACVSPPPAPAPGSITPKMGIYTNSFGAAIRMSASIKLEIHEGSAAGPIVDAAPFPITAAPLLVMSSLTNVPAAKVVANTAITLAMGAEVIDPRFNWNCDYTVTGRQWVPYLYAASNTLNNANNVALAKFSGQVADPDMSMFVADGPLHSAAELSYLVRGVRVTGSSPTQWQWWKTIRLLDESLGAISAPLDPVLDYFVVNSTNNMRVGCVNPNTWSESVVKSLLVGLPLEKFPGEGVSGLLDATAGDLARWWVSAGNIMHGSVTNLSQIGRMTNVFSDASFPSGKSPFEKEAFFRNLAGLLGVRQNYFVILLYAQAIKVTPDGKQNPSAECRAVAEVWRDARPNAEGKHPCKVRLLKILPNP